MPALTAADMKAQINQAFGKDKIKLASELAPMTYWPTGILPIDVALNGGFPVGRFTHIYGGFSTLKSLAAYSAIAEVQRAGGTCALEDTEHSADREWMEAIGVDVDELVIERPETGEEAVQTMEVLIRNGIDLIVWDSIAATQTKQFQEKAAGDDTQPGTQARMMSTALRRLNSVNKHTAIACLNQTRANIGMTFGPKITAPGGNALPYNPTLSHRWEKAIRTTDETDQWTGEKLEKKKRKIKQQIKCTVEKWKLNAPTREVFFDYDLRTASVDEVGYMIGWAIEEGYISITGGSWYEMGDVKVNGRQKFFDAIAQDEDMIEWMREQLTEGFSMASPGQLDELPKSKAAKTKSKR